MSKHNAGPWSYRKCPCGMKGCNQYTVSVQGSAGFDEADARLIAAAPDGLLAAEIAYRALLTVPHVEWRVRHQPVYCELRDFIAKATGRDSQEVQDEFEAKATGESA